MKQKKILGGFALTAGWTAMLFSVVFYLLFWRTDNEPGARDVPGLLWAAISFCSLGGVAFLGSNIYLLVHKYWLAAGIAWIICLALFVGAVTLSPVLLLLMV